MSIFEAVRIRFTFEDDLESSPAYRMAKNDCCDCSFASSVARTNAWSIFSGLSLADISVMSVVALPLYPPDIVNRECYRFGDSESRQPSSYELTATWTNHQEVIAIDATQLQDPHSEEGPPRTERPPEIILDQAAHTTLNLGRHTSTLISTLSFHNSETVSPIQADPSNEPEFEDDGFSDTVWSCIGCGEILEEGDAYELG